MNKWVWHESIEFPAVGPVVVKTSLMNYHIALYDYEHKCWLVKNGKRYVEEDKLICGSEKIVSWAYIGGEQ